MRSHRSLTATLVIATIAGLACSGDEVSAPVVDQPGQLQVVTVTEGESPDLDGYTFQLDGGQAEPIGPNAQADFESLPAGSHTVTLAGVAPNCSVREGLTQTFVVSARTMAMA